MGLAGEAHGFVWQLIVPASEQAGIIAVAANYLPRGTFAFHAENTRLIGVGITWIHLCHLFHWIASGNNSTGFWSGSLFTILPK